MNGLALSSEAKQQAALDAAQNPHSSVTASQAEKFVLDQSKAAGAQAFSFDPNASAEEKAAQAGANAPPDLRSHRTHQTAILATDQDDGNTAGYDLPSPTKNGALPLASSPSTHDAQEFSKVGWAPRFGDPADADDQGTMLDHQTWLEGKVDEKFFGDWYHNAAVIVFACISSWTIAVLGGGLGWVFIVIAACGTYYRTSIRRVRRNFRDDVRRQMAKTRLETDTESLEWMNSFLVKFWPIYAPVLCSTIVSSVDQVLSTSTPAFLDSMRMKFFTLGTKPPRLEHVKTYPKADDDIVMMDWKFSFTPNDTADMTTLQIKNKVNPKIVLEVRVGKAMISTGLDIIVEDMAFAGIMRVKLKLQIPFPHMEKAEISFLGRPTIDYVCKPLGGDTFGFDINFVPGLEAFIMEQIHANLGPMMYAPNVFPIEIAKLLSGNTVDQAVGVLQIVFHGASGLKNPDKFSGTPDPYAVVAINDRQPLGKTKTVFQNANPRWTETINVILTSLKDTLTVSVFDYNEFRKDKDLGSATFALEQLDSTNSFENLQLELIASGRTRGHVQADIRFFPVLEGSKLADGTEVPAPESSTGIAKFTVESAKELDGSKSLIGQLNPYAVLLLNGKEVHVSKKLKRTNNPIWPDATQELLITDRKKAKLGLVIKDDRDMAQDPIIGTYQIKLDDMLELMSKGQEWYNLAGASTGKFKMQLQWKPVAMTNSIGAYGGYVKPIGVMRLHLESAKNLKNVETVGKSDPYVRVMLSGVMKGRTVTFQNNLNPEWDEVIYVPVHSKREKLILEIMDEQDIGKDRSIGKVELATSDYVEQDEMTGEYQVNDAKKTLSVNLTYGPKAQQRGVLNYRASFFPTTDVIDPEEEDKVSSPTSTVGGSLPKHVGANDSRPGPSVVQDDEAKRVRSGTVGTITSLHTRSASGTSSIAMRKKIDENAKQQEETSQQRHLDPPKVQLTAADLADYECGLVVFKIIDGEMAMSGCHLEVIMDDNVFPACVTAKTRQKVFTFNEIGEAMVRELDLSKITLRLVSDMDKRGDGRDVKSIRAKLTGQTIDVLRQTLYTPTQLTLKDKEGQESKITVSMKFLPVKMKLDPSESVNNSGNLRVEVLGADDLQAMDRNGYSDPYCKFVLHGKEVFKTKVQKKTLHPIWNEGFDVPIRSRTAGQFDVSVYDWDFGEKADFLGKAAINLDILEPFQKQQVDLTLDGKSGTIRLTLLFKPDYVLRSRQGSSTFSGTFAAAPGKIVVAPVKGVGKGAAFVGGGVAKGASFLGRGFKHRKSDGGGEPTNGVLTNGDNNTPIKEHQPLDDSPTLPQRTLLSPIESAGVRDTPLTAAVADPTPGGFAISPGSGLSGTAQLSVLSATGFAPGTKVEVRIWLQDVAASKGIKEVLRTKALKAKTGDVSWEEEKHVESKRVSCTADAQFKVGVYSHGTFGSDLLGERAFFVNDQGHGGDQSLAISFSTGLGQVVVRSSFELGSQDHHGQHINGASDAASVVSAATGKESGAAGRLSTSGGALRRSLMGRRERSVTPGA